MTGAARGIGAACVEAFRGAGYRVVAVDRDECDGDEVVRGDVAERATSDDAVRVALERFGRLDHALGNAGVTLGKLIDDTVDDELERLWRVNVKGSSTWRRRCTPRSRRRCGSTVSRRSE